MINIAYVPRATANDRGSWSLSRFVDTAGIGRGVPRLLNPQHPQSNAPMWIRPRSEKSFALLAALFLSLFVFVFAAGEAGAEEQVVLPMDQWCAMPPGTAPPGTVPADTAPCPPTVLPSAVDDSPLDTSPAGTPANGVPPAQPFPPPIGSVSLPAPGPAPGTELIPWQQHHVLPSPGAEDIGGPRPEPTQRPHLSPPPETSPTDILADKPGTPKAWLGCQSRSSCDGGIRRTRLRYRAEARWFTAFFRTRQQQVARSKQPAYLRDPAGRVDREAGAHRSGHRSGPCVGPDPFSGTPIGS